DTPANLASTADTISAVYIGCAAENGSEWQAMSSALRGNAEMARVQQELADDYVALIGAAVAPFSNLDDDDLRLRCAGIAGAAETIAREFVRGRATKENAAANLAALIVNGVGA
ncbi:MAG: TetR/AcrR family transcriptional regulator, partial [Ensifer adhaerens]